QREREVAGSWGGIRSALLSVSLYPPIDLERSVHVELPVHALLPWAEVGGRLGHSDYLRPVDLVGVQWSQWPPSLCRGRSSANPCAHHTRGRSRATVSGKLVKIRLPRGGQYSAGDDICRVFSRSSSWTARARPCQRARCGPRLGRSLVRGKPARNTPPCRKA